MTNDFIIVQGAKEKNLKNISVSIPKNKITSVVGAVSYTHLDVYKRQQVCSKGVMKLWQFSEWSATRAIRL